MTSRTSDENMGDCKLILPPSGLLLTLSTRNLDGTSTYNYHDGENVRVSHEVISLRKLVVMRILRSATLLWYFAFWTFTNFSFPDCSFSDCSFFSFPDCFFRFLTVRFSFPDCSFPTKKWQLRITDIGDFEDTYIIVPHASGLRLPLVIDT